MSIFIPQKKFVRIIENLLVFLRFGCNSYITNIKTQLYFSEQIQVNLCQKLLFLHQLTNNMTTDCSLNYKFNTWKFRAQTWREHVGYRNCFWHSEQFLYTTCSPHVLQKEELLTKISLYRTLVLVSDYLLTTSKVTQSP